MSLDGTLTKISQIDVADREQLVVDLQGPSSYVNGGEPVLPSFFPFRTGGILLESVEGFSDDGLTGQVQFDAQNSALIFLTAAGVEEVDTADLSGNTYRLKVSGR